MNLRLTFSIQDVVSWEHDATAHDVPFEAAGTKSISDPAAVENLPIVCETGNKLLIGFNVSQKATTYVTYSTHGSTS